jgi:hypothetical protein
MQMTKAKLIKLLEEEVTDDDDLIICFYSDVGQMFRITDEVGEITLLNGRVTILNVKPIENNFGVLMRMLDEIEPSDPP